MSNNIDARQFKELMESGRVEVVDVRQPEEAGIIRIKGAGLIPMSEFGERLDEIDWSKTVVLHCRTGARSGTMARLVSAQGYDAVNLEGGIKACYEDEVCRNILEFSDSNKVEKYFTD